MKPFVPYRLRLLIIPLACFLAATGLSAQSAKLTVFDSLPQLEARINQAGNATIVVNFWATWCKPCVEELPSFEELRNRYANQNVQVILVSLDFKSHIEKKLIPFLKAQKLQSEVILFADQDANNWIPRVFEAWDGAIPATLVVKGAKRSFNLGQFNAYSDLESFVRPFIADSSATISTQHMLDFGTGK